MPVATAAAVRSFDEPISLIVGGYDKGLEFDAMVSAIVERNVERVICIGTVRNKIESELVKAGYTNAVVSDSQQMMEIVEQASAGLSEGSIVLLSPGCASFDMFANYKDRGNQFKGAVDKL